MNFFIGIIFVSSIILDQATKFWAVSQLKGGGSIKIIGDFLRCFSTKHNSKRIILIYTANIIKSYFPKPT